MIIRYSLALILSLAGASAWAQSNSQDISASPSQAAPNIPADPLPHNGLKPPSDDGTMPPPPVRDVPLDEDSTVHGHMPPSDGDDMQPPPPPPRGHRPPPPPEQQ